VRKVLLVRLRSIGDTVLMTPCLQALREWQPALEIGVAVETLAESVLEGHPLVERLFVTGSSLASRARVVARLRRERFDIAFNLHGGTTAMLLTAFSGAAHTVGYRDQRASSLLNVRAPAPDVILRRKRVHSVEQQLALMHWTGVPLPEHPRLSLEIRIEAAAEVRTKLIRAGFSAASVTGARFAIIAPGAAFESKRWSARRFASVIDHLGSSWQLQSIVIAGPGQQKLASEVAALSQSDPCVLSDISLAEFKALVGIFGCVFVGNDSGPMHIAAAFGCPVVAVFGSSDPGVWHPWTSAPYRVLGGERGKPDSDVRGSIDSVEVNEVVSAVDEVMKLALEANYKVEPSRQAQMANVEG
jgi:ADP-heptose:LPS heptosyltransferase